MAGIFITADSLSLTNGAQLQSRTFGANASEPGGRGNTVGVNINVGDRITLAGVNQNGVPSGISNNTEAGSVGKGGDINIKARSLSLTDGAVLNANTNGLGDAGRVFVQASSAVSVDNSDIFNNLRRSAVGNSGGIFIAAESLSLTNGAQLQSGTFGAKASEPGGRGNASGVNINVDASVTLAGANQNGSPSGIFSDIEAGATGKGGDINIQARSLSLTDGAVLKANTAGLGNGGNIIINASDRVDFDGGSSAQSSLLTGGVGKGGDIQVTTGSLSVTGGATLGVSSYGRGNAGNISINAHDTITFEGVGNTGNGVLPSSARSELGSNGVGNGGNIRVNAKALFLKNGGQLNANSFGQGNAGSITIDAHDTVAFDGFGSNGLESSANTLADENGSNGGDIRITTGTLSLTNGGKLTSFARGNAGNITIDARNTVSFDGVGSNERSSGAFSSLFEGTGKGGDIQVTTGSLSVTNGAQLMSSTTGQGNGGNITIDARDSVKFDGVGSNLNSSGAYSTVKPGGVGNAGNINVTSGSLSLNNAAQINAGTFGSGKAGDITINANSFEALNGGQVVTSTAGTGKAGTITLNVRDSLTLAGSDPNFTQRQAQVEQRLRQPGETDQLSDVIGNLGPTSGIFANTAAGSTGDGGSIFIDPRQATIRDGAKVSVNSDGTGNAGSITLQADTLTLDNGASISAQTTSSQGGNINLQLGDILLLRRGSQISTNAGTAQKGGDGGNINLNSKFIVAVPQENSNITANAYTGTGGNIQINSSAIFGIQSRPQLTDLSSITASSTLGVAGAVNVNTLNTDALQNSLTQLPSNIIDTNALLANSCIVRRKNKSAGTFLITGNGGLPQRPGDAVVSSYPTGTIRSVPSVGKTTKSATSTSDRRVQKISTPIVEPQGVYRLANGHLVLSRECP